MLAHHVKKLGACEDGVNYLTARSFPDLQTLWDQCGSPEWLAWLIYRASAAESNRRVRFINLVVELVDLAFDDPLGPERALSYMMSQYAAGSESMTHVHQKGVAIMDRINDRSRSYFMTGEMLDVLVVPGHRCPDSGAYLVSRCAKRIGKTKTLEIIRRHYPAAPFKFNIKGAKQ